MNRLKRTQFWGENKDDDRLVRQIMDGKKTATACPANAYFESDGEFEDGGFMVGDIVEVYDLNERLRCKIEITDYYTTPFGIIPEKLWKGECNRSAEEFREDHRNCWPELNLTDDFKLAINHFRLVEIINKNA